MYIILVNWQKKLYLISFKFKKKIYFFVKKILNKRNEISY